MSVRSLISTEVSARVPGRCWRRRGEIGVAGDMCEGNLLVDVVLKAWSKIAVRQREGVLLLLKLLFRSSVDIVLYHSTIHCHVDLLNTHQEGGAVSYL